MEVALECAGLRRVTDMWEVGRAVRVEAAVDGATGASGEGEQAEGVETGLRVRRREMWVGGEEKM